MINEIYKLKENICYKWIFRPSRLRNGNIEIAPQGHPFSIPVEEVECYLCNSCEHSRKNDFKSSVPTLLFLL